MHERQARNAPYGVSLTHLGPNLTSFLSPWENPTNRRMFPRDFDAAIPVIKHKEVDKLLMQVGH